MSLDTKLILNAISELFDKFDARWSMRDAARETSRRVPVPTQCTVVGADVVADNWGNLFDSAVDSDEQRYEEPINADNWGGFFDGADASANAEFVGHWDNPSSNPDATAYVTPEVAVESVHPAARGRFFNDDSGAPLDSDDDSSVHGGHGSVMSHLLEREADTAFLPHSDQRDGVEAWFILRRCTPASFNVASTDPNNEVSSAVTADALAKAAPALFASRAPRPSLKYLELLLPAEIDFDHIDLPTAAAAGHIVAQVTGNNAVSVVEDQLRCTLLLTRNFLSSHHQAVSKEWDMVAVVHPVCNLGEKVDAICTGQIEHLLLQHLKPSPTSIGAKAVFDEMQQSTNSATTTPASSALTTTTTTTMAAPATWLDAQPAVSTCSSASSAQEDTPIPLLFLRGGLGMMDNVLPANSTFLSTNISLSSMECLREFMLHLKLGTARFTICDESVVNLWSSPVERVVQQQTWLQLELTNSGLDLWPISWQSQQVYFGTHHGFAAWPRSHGTILVFDFSNTLSWNNSMSIAASCSTNTLFAKDDGDSMNRCFSWCWKPPWLHPAIYIRRSKDCQCFLTCVGAEENAK
ncbi:uncharacterized protein [Zea mays]|uniref:uncharacterized protein n=1 Tax=Zea mays TaxID=4577 RepID=UPI0016523989|nr:uncharacterized protein LOC103649793 [Zea mays]